MATASTIPHFARIPDETIRALCELAALPEDWDSYGARQIDPQSIAGAVRLLLEVLEPDTPPPAVVPTNHGRVLLEWHTGGIDLEIEVMSTQRFLMTFEDAAAGERWEREIGPELSPLSDLAGRLT